MLTIFYLYIYTCNLSMALIPMIRKTTDWRRMSFTRTHTLVTHTVTGPINEQYIVFDIQYIFIYT